MRVWVAALAACSVLAALPAAALTLPPVAELAPLPAGKPFQPFALERVVLRLSQDSSLTMKEGGFCGASGSADWEDELHWKGDMLLRPLLLSAQRLGLPLEKDPDDLFAEGKTQAGQYALGTVVTSLKGEVCAPYFGDHRFVLGPSDPSTVKGRIVAEMEWQVYSRLERKVVAKIDTKGGWELRTSEKNGMLALANGALDQNVIALANDPQFRTYFVGVPSPAAARPAPAATTAPTRLSLAAPPAAGPRKIPDAVSAVALVLTGDGHGSAFLVSSDGYLLTNAHVTDGAKYVKVRWSDGVEVLGEVVRADARRDIALVKADNGSRLPLSIKAGSPDSGATVFAIGAPLDAAFQSTVTRGVVSANRTIEGLSFIQSDVTVNPGNSGGPLLSEDGQLIGVTDLGYRPDGLPTNINLFIPINDALSVLNVDVR